MVRSQVTQHFGSFIFRRLVYSSFALIIILLGSNQSFGWVYPEHRQIALLAIQNLDPRYRAILDKLWAEASVGYTNRLTTSIIDPKQGLRPTKIDYAAWTAIGGDHSCSPEMMLNTVLRSDWILKVAAVTAQLKADLANAKNRSQRINALRNSDINLQKADLEYATRAGSNNVHFLLARPKVDEKLSEYLTACLTAGSPLNALGAYSWYHTSALQKAARYANESLSPKEKSALILAALADEAFALHFLEDVYSAGHIAGTWGNASLRKGTHDYYNEKGLEVITWDGKKMILRGDAFMRPEDADIAAENVAQSLQQLVTVASGNVQLDYKNDPVSTNALPDTFNVCKNNFMPLRKAEVQNLMAVLIKTPVPALGAGLGELPRFRSEIGAFIGVSATLNSAMLSGGYGVDQKQAGVIAGIEANIRFGLGLDGVLDESGDGLVFLQFGWKQNSASTIRFVNTDASTQTNSITAAIPGQSAYNLRLRLPFWLLPGDLLVAGPILYLVSPQLLAKMAVVAGNGGLIPWQSGMATPIGRFQFVLGREIGVSLYGLSTPQQTILIPVAAQKAVLVSYKSTELNFPVLEYEPFTRSFSQVQSSNMLVQLTWGLTIPHGAAVVSPANAALPQLKNVYQVGIRIIFDWRHYL
ncbi:hypothetical protein ACFGVR_01180 [Mucilaginibacter sp. AW1-3]